MLTQHITGSPDLLTTIKPAAARQIIHQYFDYFGMEGIQQELWELLNTALTNELAEENGLDRQRHLYFYVQTKMLMEAVCGIARGAKRVRIEDVINY